jgi:hypothetical protein
VLFTLCAAVHMASLAVAYRLSRRVSDVTLRASVFNPIIFVALVSAFFAVDFTVLYLDPYVPFYEDHLPISQGDVLGAYAAFLAMWSAALGGTYLALQRRYDGPPRRVAPAPAAFSAAGLLVVLVALAGSVLMAPDLVVSVIRGDISRQVFSREQEWMFVFSSFLPPLLAYYLSGRRLVSPATIGMTALIVGAVLVTSSRGAMVLLAITVGLKLVSEGRAVPKWLLLILVPLAAGALLLHRYLFRVASSSVSLEEFLLENGGLSGVFFRTTEISMAEVLTVIAKYGHAVDRAPYESLLGAALYPVPRSILSLKPISADAAVTAVFSPLRWAATKSEIVITGYGDMLIHFGVIIGAAVCFALAFLWGSAVKRACADRTLLVVLLPFLMHWFYLFSRSGIYNAAGSAWPWLFVTLAVLTVNRRLQQRRSV